MADSARVDRTLAIARTHFRAPSAARERVRGELAARGCFESAPAGKVAAPLLPTPRAAGVGKPTAALLAGLTFVAGYWLGGQRTSDLAPAAPSGSSVNEVSALSPAPRVAADDMATETEAIAGPARLREPAPAPADAPAGSSVDARGTRHVEPIEPQPRRHPPRKGSTKVPRAQQRGEGLGDELALLQRAERAIRSGQPELALSFLDDLERRHPETQLGEERAAARLMARCARAEPGAMPEARAFLQARRASVYSDRLRALCGLELDAQDRDGSGAAGH